ncbi:energy-coupling factor transporter transmembrane component T family protein, partial [Desulfofundulus sp.]|uniref:energy-coupling factor transporter transmembrane component T family protein n=1 Tax=Desulfofundulus sp. TaxID=2282750 RepID=UPI003C748288
GGLLQRIRGLLPLLVPLFAGAFRRAEDLATAMEIRCYRGGANRTRMHQLQYERRDYVVLAGTGALFLVTLALRWWG